MTEQTYKEAKAAVKESGIALPLQEVIQQALSLVWQQLPEPYKESGKDTGKESNNKELYSAMYIDRSRV